MDISFKCTTCGQDIVIDQAGEGSIIECPKCKMSMIVPSGSDVPTAPMKQEPPKVVVEQSQELPLQVTLGKKPVPVVVKDFDISFTNMVWLLVKLAFAALPAALILGVVAAVVVAATGGINYWITNK